MFAIDANAHKVAWEFQTDSSRQNAAAFSKPDGTPNYQAVMDENFYDSVLVGLDKLEATRSILSSPVVVNGVIYFGSSDGNVYAIM
jgi:outer membrane protein assembly factor BamB